MSRVPALQAVLNSLVGHQGVISAMLATDDGDVLAVSPTPTDSWEAQVTAEWAAEQVERLSGLRNQIGEQEFSVLFEPKDSPSKAHCHLQSMRGHVLLVLFTDRDSLGMVRRSCREAASELERVLLES